MVPDYTPPNSVEASYSVLVGVRVRAEGSGVQLTELVDSMERLQPVSVRLADEHLMTHIVVSAVDAGDAAFFALQLTRDIAGLEPDLLLAGEIGASEPEVALGRCDCESCADSSEDIPWAA